MATTQEQAEAGFSVLGSEVSKVERILRNQIRRFTDQPRNFFDAKDMNDLAASIEEIGQQTPIVVKAVIGDPKHKYELVDGERRWIACGMAGVDTMLAWVRPIKDSDEQFVASVVGNFGRSSHTPLEISQAINRIRKSKRMESFSPGEQIAKIAKIFARSEPWVYSHLALLRLHPEVQAMMSPTISEEDRLSHTLGVFISGLHHDLQMEIARMVVTKRLNINQARVQARQMAEEAGVQVGNAKRPHLIADYLRSMRRYVQRTQEGVDVLLSPPTLVAIQRRDPKDLALMATEIEQCVVRLNQLKVALTEPTSSRPQVSTGLAKIEIPEQKLVTKIPTPKPAPPPPTRSVAATPKPSASEKMTVKKRLPPTSAPVTDEDLKLARQVLDALFFSKGQPHVNLSQARLRNAVPNGQDSEEMVSRALRVASNHWRISPQGSEPKQKLIHLLYRFKRGFGNLPDFLDTLNYARRQDESQDPVNLHF